MSDYQIENDVPLPEGTRQFTEEEDRLIIETWPDYKEVAYGIDGKTTAQIYAHGVKTLGLPSRSDLGLVPDKRKTLDKKAKQMADYIYKSESGDY